MIACEQCDPVDTVVDCYDLNEYQACSKLNFEYVVVVECQIVVVEDDVFFKDMVMEIFYLYFS